MEGTPFGRYRLVELLGRGGMGEVWRAHDTATNNRTVAIKLLPPQLAADHTFVQRFRREADAAARLNNPHIIPIHTYGEIDGRLYVDMRLIEGRDLHEVLAEGPLEPGRAVRIVEQVAKALHAAHKIGLVHRDVKPSNILLDEDDFAYLIDFGIARAADETRLTGTGSIIGSWHYMSPERLRAGQVDARSDIYALACVLYECLTGSTPYPGDNFEQQITAHLTEPPPRPSSTQPNVPARVDEVIATGMAKDPDQRYATTVELANAARDAVTVPIQQPTPSPAPDPPATERAESSPGASARVPHATTAPAQRVAPAATLGATPELFAPVAKAGAREPVASPRSRKRRIIAGGAAAAIVTTVVVVALIGLGRGPTTPVTHTTSTTPTPTVGPDRLDSILLSVQDVNTVMGASGMQPSGANLHVPFGPPDAVSNSDCLGTFFAGEQPVYSGSGYTAISLEVLGEPGTLSRFVQQGVVSFPSVEMALDFVKNSAAKWRACAGQTVSVTFKNGQTLRWTVEDLVGGPPTIAQLHTLEGGGTCQRVLSAVSNLVIDVNACGNSQISDQARQIADKIAAKATQ